MSFQPGELIFYNDENGNIHSGGFSVKSMMMKNGMSPIVTLNDPYQKQKGGTDMVSDLFDNIVVPNWALYLPTQSAGNNRKEEEDDDVIDDDLHDKLLELVKPDVKEIKKGTSKNLKMKSKNKTKKNKNKNKPKKN
jgi:hypothetical protein